MSAATQDVRTRTESLVRLEAALVTPELADRMEVVVWSPGPDLYRAASIDGSVGFRRTDVHGRWSYQVVEVSGDNPLADQATDRFLGLDAEKRHRFHTRDKNAYPHAFDSIAQFFDGAHAPDLLATHTGAHSSDANIGQHGSLGAVQGRAPLILSGCGFPALGTVDRATRMVNVAPTLAALLGVEPHPAGVGPTGRGRADALLARQDGDAEADLLTGDAPDHLVVFLLDGCNANLLYDVIASGEAPNIAALAAAGTTMGRGVYASLPTATLANHTTALTGAHPGHSGIIHHAWYDRCSDSEVDLLAFDQMFHSSSHLDPNVETLFSAVKRSRPDAFTAASFEFCDTGADFSSFALVRGGATGGLPELDEVAHLTPNTALRSDQYNFMSQVDQLSVTHTIDAWRQVNGNPLPTLSWCSLSLTDEVAHEVGPHAPAARAAVRDSDARVGDVLAVIDAAGVRDRTAVVVLADHGMEESDPAVSAGWTPELQATGVAHLEVGGGLIYLT
ncbi:MULTISPECIES: alkaline phosphatase family protein [Candidatus Microthrix]|jgi:phosphonoacetate hydrolase|uniref:Putative Type I phosphodiesterase/nucleotide pyrophosphatase n=1 Tax=Candidatus Neomicrothrix parvicella RN1 TaxID=1229780 RepID=R4YZV9_9ACTN|nr:MULTISPECIES: alkaline phosphatase family protein [Microthrix]MBP7878552.1 alkaline phosphatase family protein [Candidatus Microthrix sp.]CCM61902.1 putative Type I phosphodiesterase/nucleotide pyrophosphatase [Candidatus Microthrix parvicella RN1]